MFPTSALVAALRRRVLIDAVSPLKGSVRYPHLHAAQNLSIVFSADDAHAVGTVFIEVGTEVDIR
jgi:hypothetical protein